MGRGPRCIWAYKISIEAETADGSHLAMFDIVVTASRGDLAVYLAENAVKKLGYDTVRVKTVALLNYNGVVGLVRPIEDIAPTEAYLVDEYGRLYPE